MTTSCREPSKVSDKSTACRGERGTSDHPRILILYDRQRYECIGRRNHITKDGRSTTLLVFESDCPGCGNQFELMIGEKALEANFSPNRRCSDCKQPGKPVRGRRKCSSSIPSVGKALEFDNISNRDD